MVDDLYLSILIVILLASNVYLLWKNIKRQVMMDDIDKKITNMVDERLNQIQSVENQLKDQLVGWNIAIDSNNKAIKDGIDKTTNMLKNEAKLIEDQFVIKDKKIIELQNELYKTQNILNRYRKKIKGGQNAS